MSISRIPYNRLLNLTLDLLREISRIPFAYRTWRKEVWDFFLEPRFFDMTPSNVKRWRAITQTIMTSERERIDDLLGRIVVTPSGLFTSREQETVNRSTMLRRLAFVVLCGEKDQFLPQLPVIQEKMVEQFKQGYNVAHAEVYLFLRVLITRISTSKLSSFWPVVLNELVCDCRADAKVLKSLIPFADPTL